MCVYNISKWHTLCDNGTGRLFSYKETGITQTVRSHPTQDVGQKELKRSFVEYDGNGLHSPIPNHLQELSSVSQTEQEKFNEISGENSLHLTNLKKKIILWQNSPIRTCQCSCHQMPQARAGFFEPSPEVSSARLCCPKIASLVKVLFNNAPKLNLGCFTKTLFPKKISATHHASAWGLI